MKAGIYKIRQNPVYIYVAKDRTIKAVAGANLPHWVGKKVLTKEVEKVVIVRPGSGQHFADRVSGVPNGTQDHQKALDAYADTQAHDLPENGGKPFEHQIDNKTRRPLSEEKLTEDKLQVPRGDYGVEVGATQHGEDVYKTFANQIYGNMTTPPDVGDNIIGYSARKYLPEAPLDTPHVADRSPVISKFEEVGGVSCLSIATKSVQSQGIEKVKAAVVDLGHAAHSLQQNMSMAERSAQSLAAAMMEHDRLMYAVRTDRITHVYQDEYAYNDDATRERLAIERLKRKEFRLCHAQAARKHKKKRDRNVWYHPVFRCYAWAKIEVQP